MSLPHTQLSMILVIMKPSYPLQVQKRVREVSIKLAEENPQRASGQVPVYISTLTNLRKLYLFPGYDGPRRRVSVRRQNPGVQALADDDP